jgi:hypothetical protein
MNPMFARCGLASTIHLSPTLSFSAVSGNTRSSPGATA